MKSSTKKEYENIISRQSSLISSLITVAIAFSTSALLPEKYGSILRVILSILLVFQAYSALKLSKLKLKITDK